MGGGTGTTTASGLHLVQDYAAKIGLPSQRPWIAWWPKSPVGKTESPDNICDLFNLGYSVSVSVTEVPGGIVVFRVRDRLAIQSHRGGSLHLNERISPFVQNAILEIIMRKALLEIGCATTPLMSYDTVPEDFNTQYMLDQLFRRGRFEYE